MRLAIPEKWKRYILGYQQEESEKNFNPDH